MDLFVIGETDTVLGFAYAGVPGVEVADEEEARRAFREAVDSGRVEMIIITESVARLIREEVDQVRFRGTRPVVVEIPGPAGPAPDRRGLLELIREAVGIRV